MFLKFPFEFKFKLPVYNMNIFKNQPCKPKKANQQQKKKRR